MRGSFPIAMILVAVSPVGAEDVPKLVLPLRVLYVGKPGSDRARQFETFLKGRFASAAASDRDSFNPGAAAGADVVILDWSRSLSRDDARAELAAAAAYLQHFDGARVEVLTVDRRVHRRYGRLVPIAASAVDRLHIYRLERVRLLGASAGAFFRNDNGHRLTEGTARYNFAVVAQAIGLREAQRFCKNGRGPRIHDLRHTFTVRTIMAWYRDGLDPDREMSKLSTYLGHARPEDTYWYFEAVPELLQLASERAERAMYRDASKRISAR